VFAILSVVNFEIPACHRSAAVQYDFSRMRRGSLQMVWYGNVHFKQWAVGKFPVAEKELVTNVHKRLQNIFDISAADKSTVSSCVSRIAGSAKQLRQLMGKAGKNYPGPDYIAHVFVFLGSIISGITN